MADKMTMVEKMARAMWAQRRKFAGSVPIELEDWGDGSIPKANGIFEEAQAAIEAMREPTEEMKAACMAPRVGSPMESYTAMIDAALGIPNLRNHP